MGPRRRRNAAEREERARKRVAIHSRPKDVSVTELRVRVDALIHVYWSFIIGSSQKIKAQRIDNDFVLSNQFLVQVEICLVSVMM